MSDGALSANASCIQLRLYGWPAECDVTGFSLRLRPAGGGWRQAGPFPPDRDLAEVCGLRPASVYQVVVGADSEAGSTETATELATLTLDGGEARIAHMLVRPQGHRRFGVQVMSTGDARPVWDRGTGDGYR